MRVGSVNVARPAHGLPRIPSRGLETVCLTTETQSAQRVLARTGDHILSLSAAQWGRVDGVRWRFLNSPHPDSLPAWAGRGNLYQTRNLLFDSATIFFH